MQGRLTIAAIGVLAVAGAAAAQIDSRVEQAQAVPVREEPAIGIPQVGAQDGQPSVSTPVAQLSTPGDGDAPPAQLTSERRTGATAPQLSRGKTAREPDPLSRPSEGRTAAVARVDGRDRCDPGADAERPSICQRVIETRAGEFVAPDPLRLSPEQRLLVDQRLREATGSARLAGRRADEQSLDPDDFEGQAVAATALAGQASEGAEGASSPTLPKLPEASAALIQALLQNAGAQSPR